MRPWHVSKTVLHILTGKNAFDPDELLDNFYWLKYSCRAGKSKHPPWWDLLLEINSLLVWLLTQYFNSEASNRGVVMMDNRVKAALSIWMTESFLTISIHSAYHYCLGSAFHGVQLINISRKHLTFYLALNTFKSQKRSDFRLLLSFWVVIYNVGFFNCKLSS